MTTTTWTSAATTTTATTDIASVAKPKLAYLKRFAAVALGVNADKDDHFRGLDLNGNAMWSKK